MAASPIMSGHKSPLRDRLLSNSPDPIKDSIIRESGMGWIAPTSNTGSMSSGASGSITSPLRIAKRESSPRLPQQTQLARRSSSSFKHVTRNNLVSKSPFKSQIPAPSPSSKHGVSFPVTRKVSGEKRQRPSSMHEQAENENERPFALKRERRQSRTFQGLIQKEPVTKSPFRQRTPSSEEPPALPPQPLVHLVARAPTASSASSLAPEASRVSNLKTSPGRPSLVSRRMRGPRLSGGVRRERRKTVTFDERCDVVEFDREDETDEEVILPDAEDGSDDYDMDQGSVNQDEADTFFSPEDSNYDDGADEGSHDRSHQIIQLPDLPVDEPSLFGMALNSDASISGLVDEMFASSTTAISASKRTPSPPLDAQSTAGLVLTPRSNDGSDFPVDLETEGGIPLGRSHAIRFLRQHSQSPQPPPRFSPSQRPSPAGRPYGHRRSTSPRTGSLQGTPQTPPQSFHSPRVVQTINDSIPVASAGSPLFAHQSPSLDDSHFSTPPLGRSTHAERIKKAREDDSESNDVLMLPGTPSPIKTKQPTLDSAGLSTESLIPRFEVGAHHSDASVTAGADGNDPFSLPSPQEDSTISLHATTPEPSILEDVQEEEQHFIQDDGPHYTGNSNPVDGRVSNESSPTMSMPAPRASLSPSLRASPSIESIGESGGSRPRRINPQDMRRRLLDRHGSGSPASGRGSPIPGLEKQPAFLDGVTVEKEVDRLSVITAATDFSTETAIIGLAERKILTRPNPAKASTPEDMDMRIIMEAETSTTPNRGTVDTGGSESFDDMEILNPPVLDVKAENPHNGSLKMGDVDVDMDMRSALDRLMDDVAGTKVEASMHIDEDYSPAHRSRSSANHRPTDPDTPESAVLHHDFASRSASMSSALSIPPPPPPKENNIRSREQMIIDKRRELKRAEDDVFSEFSPVSKVGGKGRRGQELLGVGRPARRRSMSTGDADRRASRTRSTVLDVAGVGELEGLEDHLGDSIEKELQKKMDAPPHKQKKTKYLVRERGMIYASSSDPDSVSHMAGPGDVDTGKAWRAVRRPSDMNEYSRQIKEYRALEKPGKAYGKVFVKVLGVKGIHLPLPSEPTALTCTLNNGIHFVSTPECRMSKDFAIEQEFELIEHNRLEFTLTLKVRRDPHVISQFKALSAAPPAPPPMPPPVVQTTSKGGMRSFFSSSPKKSSKDRLPPQPPAPIPRPPPQKLPENLARYLKPDGTLARAFVSFKDIAHRCDSRLFETSYPLIGQRVEVGGKYSTLQVGEIIIQMFRLPPLPGIPTEQLPQSLEECHRGLRHINWHKVTYFEGTLTQSGGDCNTWRRRRLRVIGSNLVAFNDVTKKATVAIDLKKAIAVEDDQDIRNNALGPRISRYDEYDGLYGVERSFRLVFSRDQEIIFFADTDEEKARWLDVLRALVGHIPPHPLWAELLWQRQEDIAMGVQPPDMRSQSPPMKKQPPPPRAASPAVGAQPAPPASRPSTQSTPSWLLPKAPQR